MTSADAAVNDCQAITTVCKGKDDVDGLGNLCLRVGANDDAETCGLLSGTCLTFCETGQEPTREGGAPDQEACEAMGDACHDYDEGTGLGRLCHDIGHKANVAQCSAIYDDCARLCQIHEDDGGAHSHDEETDAAVDGSSPALESFTFNFAAKVGSQAFACGTTYEGVGTAGSTITPADLRLYVSNIQLITADGSRVPVSLDTVAPFQSEWVALLDFEDGSGECRNGNEALNSQITGKAPANTYVGVAFSTSVPLEVNHADPTTLAAPLEPSDMTWGWLFGYKFIKAEVMEIPSASDAGMDAGADAGAPMAGVGIFHLGSTACENSLADGSVGTVECANPNRNEITFADFDANENTIVLDVAQLFAGADLSTMVMCHSMGDACAPLFNNVGLDLQTGTALDAQTAFRVE